MLSADINYYPEQFDYCETISKDSAGKPTRIDFYRDRKNPVKVMQHITVYDSDKDMKRFDCRTITKNDLID